MIRVQIGAIWHYGIYVSDAEVIQFGMPPRGTLPPPEEIEVCVTDIGVFSGGSSVEVARYTLGERLRKRSAGRIVEAARRSLGQKGYDVLRRNCEHFAMECVFGRASSAQADAFLDTRKEPVEVWVCRVGDEPDGTDVHPALRREEIDSTADPLLKRQRVADWQLLSRMIRQRTGKEARDFAFSRTPAGKWVCDGPCFSLSHSGDWAAAAVSDQPVGVDIEALSGRDEEALRDNLSRLLTGDGTKGLTDLLALWTRKESWFKRSEEAAFDPQNAPPQDPVTRTYLRDGDWCLSVSGQSGQEIRLRLWDGGETHALEVSEWDMD